MIAEMLKRLSSKRRIIGIDSFEGLPEETEHDVMKNGNVLYSKGKFKNESSYDYTMLATKAFRVERYASYVKGFFSEIFPQLKIDSQFSLVIIDPDQYKGTMESLDTFYKYVTPGGYFLIDDYNSCAAVGVKKAVDEFLEDKPESIQNGGLTMGYFQKK